MKVIEAPDCRAAGIKDFFRDVGSVYVSNAITAFLFSCTGPVAIVVAVGIAGGLSEIDLASWIFGSFVIAGAVTIGFSVVYRQPLSFAWTIPGSVLLGSALDHLSFAEVIGAFWVTGALMAVVGLSGTVRKALQSAPMPIVMGMVAGVFLQFGLDLVLAFKDEFLISTVMVLGFLAIAVFPRVRGVIPPVAVALVAGAIAVWATGASDQSREITQWVGMPNLYWPEFSSQALIELVIPLAITVLVVQNGQGFAVLSDAGHRPPVNAMTATCGFGSFLFALFGSVCMCVTGPSNAVLASQGERARQYTGGVIFGALCILFGLFSFGATWLMLSLPFAFIAVLGGLALMPVLQRAFVAAFSGRFAMGALVTLLVTVSDISILNIGSPFWGLVFGFAVSGLLERDDFRSP